MMAGAGVAGRMSSSGRFRHPGGCRDLPACCAPAGSVVLLVELVETLWRSEIPAFAGMTGAAGMTRPAGMTQAQRRSRHSPV